MLLDNREMINEIHQNGMNDLIVYQKMVFEK